MNPSPKPVMLALSADMLLRQQLEALLPEYDFYWELEQRGTVKTAADLRPAALLVDLGEAVEGWLEIIWALRANSATRRIPIIGITALDGVTDAAQEFEALVSRDELPGSLAATVRRYARLWDDTYYIEMRSLCEEELSEMARRGIALFDRQEFWEAHEALEQAWIEETRRVRDLYRAILQVGIAYYHIERGNYRGAIKMFLRAVQWLDPLPDACQGIDIARFRHDAAKVRTALEALTPDKMAEFDRLLIKPVPLARRKS